MKRIFRWSMMLACILMLAHSSVMASNKNDMDTIRQDCADMVNFFKSTLFENYGDSVAFKQFWDIHQKFEGNYIIHVDRQKLYDLVQRSHERTWRGFIIGFPPGQDYLNADDVYWKSRTFLNASVVNAISIVPSVLWENAPSSTYFSECLAKSEHPYLMRVYGHAQTSFQLNAYQVSTELLKEYNVFRAFRKGNEEIQLLLTIYFWPYLCHCANIDVYSGMWRDDLYKSIK